ncbi:hypothetical protein DACRYDRAFT_17286 [Dacryopinax primogenitus]|uniref:Uncharacterized protein n=1 Tax=Dacryopinax primogenitus (strain DJM 731) TaxID=1858805 RepID=M5FRA5_DACPD|nr:uncharacterized protein DACRYDRAFT_17286 [Dacryopinax primogenitus]EJT99630.1 hypothetical protein DACRYDRAFT_17286 [Dacryopinax primogenitus]
METRPLCTPIALIALAVVLLLLLSSGTAAMPIPAPALPRARRRPAMSDKAMFALKNIEITRTSDPARIRCLPVTTPPTFSTEAGLVMTCIMGACPPDVEGANRSLPDRDC